MAQYKKALLAAFAPDFKAAGFRKSAATWHRVNKDTIDVFNVQTSQWSEDYYFNAGVYLRALGPHEAPPHFRCPIRTRIPRSPLFNPNLKPAWDRWIALSDFSAVHGDAGFQILELKELIFPLATKWFAQFRDLETIRLSLCDEDSAGEFSRDVWSHFGISPESRR